MTTDQFPNVPTVTFEQAKTCIQPCDLLLASGSSLIDDMIKTGTSSPWSHIGMLLPLVDSDINRIMMMESIATVGVRSVPLDHYVSNYNGTGKGFSGKIMVARYNNFPLSNIESAANKALDLLGYPYSMDDIMAITARIGLNTAFGAKLPGDVGSQTAYICSEYVEACYQAAGVTVPYNTSGYIAPSDFAACSDIVPLFYIKVVS